MKKLRVERGQCFGCGTWLWTADPDGIMIPLPQLREGYLFCDNNELAKISACLRCEEDLLGGYKKTMDECLRVFIEDFNGKVLTNPHRYENSKTHWRNKGVFIPVPWEQSQVTATLIKNLVEDCFKRFKMGKHNGTDTPIFSQYLLGAQQFADFIVEYVRGGSVDGTGGSGAPESP